jgi:xanthine/uracil permease
MPPKPVSQSRTIWTMIAVILLSGLAAGAAVLANAPEWTPPVLAAAVGACATAMLAIVLRLVTTQPIGDPNQPPTPPSSE